MTVKLEDLAQRAEVLLQTAVRTRQTARGGSYDSIVDSASFAEMRTAALSFIERTFGAQHTYYVEFSKMVKDVSFYETDRAIGILKAIRDEIAGGWIRTTRGLVSAEVFGDFLEMADHLMDEGFHHPAAVLTGSVLEEHLRQLSEASGLPVKDASDAPLKADRLNAELKKKDVYNALDQKQVTAWLDLRNKAAHGRYEEYEVGQVKLMLAGVKDFLARHQT